jgi:hypothetical protein
MGRSRIMVTSYSVTVVSPHGRWNVWGSGCHRSTSAINAAESIVGDEASKRQELQVTTSKSQWLSKIKCDNPHEVKKR